MAGHKENIPFTLMALLFACSLKSQHDLKSLNTHSNWKYKKTKNKRIQNNNKFHPQYIKEKSKYEMEKRETPKIRIVNVS